jgi:hypothetical protein
MTGGLPPISSSWWQTPWDSRPVFFFNWTLAVIVLMYHPLWREDAFVVYNCCWPSPAQSFSGPSPAGLMTTFYCLRFETPTTWRARSPYLYPIGTGWPSYTPRHWVPFSAHPRIEFPLNNIKIHFVPHKKHNISVTKTSRLMLFRDAITVYCEKHMKHTYILCGHNADF